MSRIMLLDGGMGQELVARATGAPTPLWSTQVMLDHPGLVAQVHRDFAAAGATVATTNTYAIHRDRLIGTEHEDRFEELHAMALTEIKSSGATCIAGAIGPIGASYRADLLPDAAKAKAIFEEFIAQIVSDCDVLLAETVVSVAHATCVLDAAKTTGKPVWLAMSVDDQDGSKLRSGEPLEDVLPVAAQGAAAVLINCSVPEAIPAALAILARAELPFGAYANGFEKISDGFLDDKPTVDALQSRRDLTPEIYADHVLSWVDAGATIVGGCCEVGPAHIAEIARRLRAGSHEII